MIVWCATQHPSSQHTNASYCQRMPQSSAMLALCVGACSAKLYGGAAEPTDRCNGPMGTPWPRIRSLSSLLMRTVWSVVGLALFRWWLCWILIHVRSGPSWGGRGLLAGLCFVAMSIDFYWDAVGTFKLMHVKGVICSFLFSQYTNLFNCLTNIF